MEHESGSHHDIASGLVIRRRLKEIGLTSGTTKSRYESTYHEDKCRYCKKEGHWKLECPKLKHRKEKDLNDVASVAEDIENVFSVSTSLVSDA